MPASEKAKKRYENANGQTRWSVEKDNKEIVYHLSNK